MSQQACIEFPNALYHVCSRGFNREQIFHDYEDYNFFLYLLKKAHIKFQVLIHSYCLIPNHYHLFIETPHPNLSLAMKFINESFAKFYIKKYPNHDGYVFSRRFRRQVVQEQSYAFNLFLYVNGNAIKHELVTDASQWQWSSFNILAGKEIQPLYLNNSMFRKYFSTSEEFRKAISTHYKPSWNPEIEAVGKTILGDDNFTQKIIENHVDLDNENIIGRREMIHHYQTHITQNLHEYVSTLNLEPRLKENCFIYLMLEHTNFTRRELGYKFNLSANAIGQRASRLRQQLGNNESLRELLEPENFLS